MPPITKKRMPFLAVPLMLSTSMLLATQAFAAPTANPNTYTISKGQSFSFNPMKNDGTDPGHWIFIEEVDDPSDTNSGTTTIVSGDTIKYTPPTNGNYTGTTTFFYGIKSVPNGENPSANNLITSAQVTINVTDDGGGIPQPPASPAPIAYGETNHVESGGTITIDALSNDAGDGLTIVQVGNPFGERSDGTYFSTGSASIVNNRIRFVADGVNAADEPNFSTGKTVFFYEIKDSQGRNFFGNTTVVVAAPTGSIGPNAGDDNAEFDPEVVDGPTIWIAPFWNDTGSNLKITAVGTSQNSSTEIVDNERQISYTPKSGFSGSDTFTYTVTDEFGNTDTASITVAVLGGPNTEFPRPVANGDAYTVAENRPNIVLNVLANDEADNDPNGRTLSVTAASLGVTAFDGDNVVYTPNTNFTSGTDSFFYTITDSLGRESSANVTVTIGSGGGGGGGGGENQNPDAVEDIDRIGIVPGATQNERNVTSFVLSNDTDPDNDNLTVQSVGAARFGSVREAGGQIFYTPPSFLVSGGFTYVVSDGNGGTDAAAVTFGIVDINNPTNNPNVSGESITVAPGVPFPIDVIANDSDPDDDTLTLDQVTGGAKGTFTTNGNVITYTANPGESGTDQLFYGVADGQGGNGSGTLTITIQ